MNPQPLTAAPWLGNYVDSTRMRPATKFMLENSDVLTFHSYDASATVEKLITALERYGRPVICSEYMLVRAAAHSRASCQSLRGDMWAPSTGLCLRKDADDLSMGFVEQRIHCRAEDLVPRHLPRQWHAV